MKRNRPSAATPSRPSFAEDHGWGWNAIEQAVRAIHWLGPGSDEEATAAARRIVKRAARSVQAWATKQDASLPRAIRNLVPEAPFADLPLWRLVLVADDLWPADAYPEIAPLAQALDDARTPGADLLMSMLRGEEYADDALEDLLGESMKLFDRALGRRLRAEAPLTAVDLVTSVLDEGYWMEDRQRLQLIKRAAYFYPPATPLSIDDLESLSADDVELLARWPHLIRILEGRGVAPADGRTHKTQIPRDGIAAELRVRQLGRRNQRLEDAIAALEAREYSSAAFDEVADDGRFGPVPKEFLERFRAALTAETDLRVPAGRVASATEVAKQLPADLGLAYVFVLSPPVDRVRVIRSAAEADRRKAMALLHASELVATLAAPDLPPDDLRDLVETISRSSSAGPVVAAITGIGEATVSAPIPPILDRTYADWLELGDAERIDDDQRHVLVRRGLDHLRPAPATLAALAHEDLTSLPHEDVLSLLLDADRSESFRAIDQQQWSRLYRAVVHLGAETGWLEDAPGQEPGTTIVEAAMVSAPRLALGRLATDGALLDPAIVALVPPDELSDWLDAADAAPELAALAERAARERRQLPEPLAQAALDHPDLLGATLAVSPSSLPLEQVLEQGLASRAAGSAVDAHVGIDERWSLLPWVREHYADRPGLAVAHEVAVAFGLSYAGYLRHLARMVELPVTPERAGRQFDSLYRTYQLPKKRGGNRTITVPERALRGLQRMILANGFESVRLHPAATGFRKGHSILDNAAPHAGKAIVVNIDIESFFPSTRYESVVRACRQLCDGGLSPAAVRLVADICSYDGGLPIGAPTSPAIANVILRGVDSALTTVAERRDLTYTRYADDLTFSGDEGALTLIPFARRLLAELGYRLERRKTNVYRRGRRQIVTGLVVNDRPDLPRRTRRRLRAALHRREHGATPEWHGRPMSDQMLTGWFAFEAILRPAEGRQALARIRELSSGKSKSS